MCKYARNPLLQNIVPQYDCEISNPTLPTGTTNLHLTHKYTILQMMPNLMPMLKVRHQVKLFRFILNLLSCALTYAPTYALTCAFRISH